MSGKYPKTLGRIEAVWNKLGGEDGVDRFLRDEFMVVAAPVSWLNKGGVIYFSVTSDGTTGKDWIKRLESKGFSIGDYARRVLLSSDFVATHWKMTQVAVLKGVLFENKGRTTNKVRTEADKRRLSKPNPELACLIRDKFTDAEIEAMGLKCIVAMHEPINDSEGNLNLLGVKCDAGGRWFSAFFDMNGGEWESGTGFAFTASEVYL